MQRDLGLLGGQGRFSRADAKNALLHPHTLQRVLLMGQVELLKTNDDSPTEFIVHDEAEGKKYVATLVKIMSSATSDDRAQSFAVSR